MKTIEEIHRENLEALAEEFGGVAVVAETIGCSSSQYSQWMKGSKNSGTGKRRGMRPSSARRIEKACGKPSGWLDRHHSDLTLSETPGSTASQKMEVLDAVQYEWLALLKHLDRDDIAEFTAMIRVRQERNLRVHEKQENKRRPRRADKVRTVEQEPAETSGKKQRSPSS